MKKRFITILAAIGVVLSLCSCTTQTENKQVSEFELLNSGVIDDSVASNLSYKIYRDRVTSTCFAVISKSNTNLIIDLVDVDGNPKLYSKGYSNTIKLDTTDVGFQILVDEDTGVNYIVTSNLNSYRIRTLETGEVYKDLITTN